MLYGMCRCSAMLRPMRPDQTGQDSHRVRLSITLLQVSKVIASVSVVDDERPAKKAKLGRDTSAQWKTFAEDVMAARRSVEVAGSGFAFQFVEGLLTKALRTGQWILLDEINLAPPQVCIMSMRSSSAAILCVLSEDIHPQQRVNICALLFTHGGCKTDRWHCLEEVYVLCFRCWRGSWGCWIVHRTHWCCLNLARAQLHVTRASSCLQQ